MKILFISLFSVLTIIQITHGEFDVQEGELTVNIKYVNHSFSVESTEFFWRYQEELENLNTAQLESLSDFGTYHSFAESMNALPGKYKELMKLPLSEKVYIDLSDQCRSLKSRSTKSHFSIKISNSEECRFRINLKEKLMSLSCDINAKLQCLKN